MINVCKLLRRCVFVECCERNSIQQAQDQKDKGECATINLNFITKIISTCIFKGTIQKDEYKFRKIRCYKLTVNYYAICRNRKIFGRLKISKIIPAVLYSYFN